MLQDYGRYQGIPLSDLTFTHKVISDNPDTKDNEFSIVIQKRLNIVRKAFKVLTCSKVLGKGTQKAAQMAATRLGMQGTGF